MNWAAIARESQTTDLLRPRGEWVGLKPPREEDPTDDRGDDKNDATGSSQTSAPSEEDVPTPTPPTDDAPTTEQELENGADVGPFPVNNERSSEGAGDGPTDFDGGAGTGGDSKMDMDDADETGADKTGGGADAEPKTKKKPKFVIVDFPGFEGHELSHETAVKLVFLRPGTKEASRMLRVQNRLKSGTAAVPLVVEEERAAGVHANVDMLLLFGKAAECITVVALWPQYFNVGSEKRLVNCSSAELRDPKTTIDGFIMYGAESPRDMANIWFDPNRQSVSVANVPAICTRECNPEITETDVGKPVWELCVDDLQVLLALCSLASFFLVYNCHFTSAWIAHRRSVGAARFACGRRFQAVQASSLTVWQFPVSR